MSDPFQESLELTIRYVEHLKNQGVRHVPVAREHIAALQAPLSPRRAATVENPPPAPPTPIAEPSSPNKKPPELNPSARQPDLKLDSAQPPAAPALEPEMKTAAVTELQSRAMTCVKCPHLVSSRTQVVFGVGNIHSPLMFVGEAPGADEDVQGEPFVGKAGQLLTRIIVAMGYERSTVYIANVLKCRPDTPGQKSGNRKPTSEEMKTCLPYLLEQIELIRPQVIVALGATAVEGLFGRPAPITRIRGQWMDLRGTPVMPTYHPAYLLRNQSPVEKRKVWEDMLQVLERLGAPISEKQRSYFREARPS